MKKYDKIGVNYDTTRRADPFILSRLLYHLRPQETGRYLDLACGSGNYTAKMAGKSGIWSGIDQSAVMLEKARSKSDRVEWKQGDADALPFEKDQFDGVACTLAVHHFTSLVRVFAEVRRVLREGRFVIFTSTTEQMKGYWLTEYFPVAMERSWKQMPDFSKIETALAETGFRIAANEPYFIRDDLQDLFLYSGKHDPEIYLNAGVRKGISTFSSLADKDEIETGCEKLQNDIATGRIKDVIASFENDLGDYCFVVCE